MKTTLSGQPTKESCMWMAIELLKADAQIYIAKVTACRSGQREPLELVDYVAHIKEAVKLLESKDEN